jgi:hypothetical protein
MCHVQLNQLLPPFLFICRWIVQNYTIPRQIKRNGGSIWEGPFATRQRSMPLAVVGTYIWLKWKKSMVNDEPRTKLRIG